ncbi:hypothetical protein CRG98_031042 [Punica granatum]|uniref:Uncharacterized protein n=1 Tax=Punica granatum TaxID=22663 RepID=A0A2I0IY06_PUNGR|nr:hypothetical protein CRG98_031042 [Punica granatum]
MTAKRFFSLHLMEVERLSCLPLSQRTAKAPPQLDLSSVPAPASSTSSNHGFDIKLPFPDWERSPFFSSPLLPSSTQ